VKVLQFDATLGYEGEGPDRWSTPYNPETARRWPDIVKFLKELYPEAQRSGIFNLAVSFNRARRGHHLMTGTNADAQVGACPRPGVRGPDLTQCPESNLRKVFYGCMPGQVVGILSTGILARLTQEDVNRQITYDGKKDPRGVIYVTKYKRNAAGYPMASNDASNNKMGEKFTEDDTPDYAAVLEGYYVIEDENGCTRLWENKGTRKNDGGGGYYFTNQQWAIVPEAVTWTCVHWYPIERPDVNITIEEKITLRDEMKWKEKEWNRRCALAQSRVAPSDISTLAVPAPVPDFAPPKKIPDPATHPNWVPGHLRKQGGKKSARVEDPSIQPAPAQSASSSGYTQWEMDKTGWWSKTDAQLDCWGQPISGGQSSSSGGGTPGGPPRGAGETSGTASASSTWRHENPAGLTTTVRRTFIEVVEEKPKMRRVQSAPPPEIRRDDDADDVEQDEEERTMMRPAKKRKKKKDKHREVYVADGESVSDITGDDVDGDDVSSELTDLHSGDEPMDEDVFERHRDMLVDLKPKTESTGVDLFPFAKKRQLKDVIRMTEDDKARMRFVVEAHAKKKAAEDFAEGLREREVKHELVDHPPAISGKSSSSSAGGLSGGPLLGGGATAPMPIGSFSSSSKTKESGSPGGPPTWELLEGKTIIEQKTILGEFIYEQCKPKVKRAGKVTGMFLEGFHVPKLLEMCKSPDLLEKEVGFALETLRIADAEAFQTAMADMQSHKTELPDPDMAARPVGPAPQSKASGAKRPRDKPRPEPRDPNKGYPGEGPGVLVSGGRKKVSRPKNQPVRDVKRGELAWQNVEMHADKYGEAAQRLLVHTVADDVGLKQYLPAVKKFLDFAQREKLSCVTWEEIDSALLRYMGMQCYVENRHPQQGVLAINGVCYLYPEAVRELPHAWRATKGWSRFAIVKEGQPVPLQALVCMSHFLRSIDDPKASVAADCIELAADGYLREQDLFQLRHEDVILTDSAATLLLGKVERGEGCKSGRDQGVVLDEPNSMDILQRTLAGKKPGEKVFDIGADNYRRYWRKAAKEVLGDSQAAGTPHSARHTGASRDLTEGYRNLEQVMKRGRWKALNSVHRYAKPHAWYAALAALPRQVREQGDLILNARASRKQLAT